MNSARIAGVGSVLLGIGVAVAAVLGPLGLGMIDFRTSEHIETQFVGGEVVSLGVVAPVAISAGVLWLRGNPLAPALAFGPAAYAVYTYASVVLGQDYSRYEGNVEQFFPLYAGLVATGTLVTALSWSALSQREAPAIPAGLNRAIGGVFLGLGLLFALAWARQIQLVATGDPPTEYSEGPNLFWTIKLFDCAFVIPIFLTTALGLLRGHRLAARMAPGVTGFATCMAGSVAGMAAAMEITGDPSSQPALLAIVAPAAAGLALATARLLRLSARPAPDHRWSNLRRQAASLADSRFPGTS